MSHRVVQAVGAELVDKATQEDKGMKKKILFAVILCAFLLSFTSCRETTIGTFELDGTTASVVWRVRQIISLNVEPIGVFNDGLLLIQERVVSDKHNYVDIFGNVSERRTTNYKYYYIDKDGKVAVQPEHDLKSHQFPYRDPISVQPFSEGLAAVERNGKFGFINTSGDVIIPFEFSIVSSFAEGLCYVVKDGIDGFIDKTGEMVITDCSVYSGLVSFGDLPMPRFSEGLASVKSEQDDTWGFIDKTGNMVMTFNNYEYDYVGNFSEGLAIAWLNQKMGFIDKTGELIIPMEYNKTNDFSEGLAHVSKTVDHSSKYGYIDKKGEVIIPFKYTHALPFSGGLAIVHEEFNNRTSENGFIDKTGKLVIPFTDVYSSTPFSEGLTLMGERKFMRIGYGILEIVQ